MIEFNATFLVAMFSFVLFILIMNAIFYRPILNIIRKREDYIASNTESVQKFEQKAEELNPTMESAWWIYYIEDQLGNTERAAEYLDKAVERGFDKDGGAG
jgi:predicted PurR-regulated permease PerM